MDTSCTVIAPSCTPGSRSEPRHTTDHALIPVHKATNIALRVCAGIAIGRDITKVWGQVPWVTAVGVLVVPMWGWEGGQGVTVGLRHRVHVLQT